jgi:hypothetical protein
MASEAESGQHWAEEGGRVEALAGRGYHVAADSWCWLAARTKEEEKKQAGANRWVPLVRFENNAFYIKFKNSKTMPNLKMVQKYEMCLLNRGTFHL